MILFFSKRLNLLVKAQIIEELKKIKQKKVDNKAETGLPPIFIIYEMM